MADKEREEICLHLEDMNRFRSQMLIGVSLHMSFFQFLKNCTKIVHRKESLK